MNATFSLAVPFFGLVILGFAVGKLLRLRQEGLRALDGFVSHVALPVFFFSYIADAALDEVVGVAFLLTTAFSTYCAFAIAFSVGALLNRGNVPEATIQGLAGSWSSTALLAPGIVFAMFGPAAALPIALVFSFDVIVLTAVTPLMMALGGTDQRGASEMTQAILRRIVLHPIVLATLLGLVAATVEVPWPEPLEATLAMLRGAAPAAALFAAGAMLATAAPPQVPREVPYLAAIKLIVHPMIVYVLLGWVGDFPPEWVYSAILIAALPSAPDVLAEARGYKTFEATAAASVLAITTLSIVSLSVFIYLVGNRILPADLFP